MTAVQVEDVWKYYTDLPALREIRLELQPGVALALLGRNGAGKTTLLRILAGLSTPSKGRVELFGAPPRSTAGRRRVGVLGHGIGVYDELSALENLMLFARLAGLADPRAAAREWLERTSLAGVENHPVREFSRGMRQRVAVSRAFLHSPDILLLDEPFTSLDDRAVALLQSLIRQAIARGATVVMSTHQLREAMELATDVCLLDRGRLVHRGPRTAEMLADPGWLYRNYGDAG
jgi:heme exporter protein A